LINKKPAAFFIYEIEVLVLKNLTAQYILLHRSVASPPAGGEARKQRIILILKILF